VSDVPWVEQLSIPVEYGAPSRLLRWSDVEARLEQALHYWLASVRPDSRPHVVPLDGVWLDGAWYFGGSPTTVKHRNLLANGNVAMHLEDATAATIVEGVCEVVQVDDATALRLAEQSKAKYGYGPPPDVYRNGVWRLRPARVLSWTDLTADATRFTFA
jgi:hypothetical protein